jgi:hypothetical protein
MHGVQHAAGEEKLSAHEFFMQRRKKKRRRAHDDVRRERGHTELLLHLRRRTKSVHKSYHWSRRAAQCFLLVPAFVDERLLLSLACRCIFLLLLHAVVRICKTLPHSLSLSLPQHSSTNKLNKSTYRERERNGRFPLQQNHDVNNNQKERAQAEADKRKTKITKKAPEKSKSKQNSFLGDIRIQTNKSENASALSLSLCLFLSVCLSPEAVSNYQAMFARN